MCLRAEKFARRLNNRYNLPFYTHDERLTTFEAKGERRDRGGQGQLSRQPGGRHRRRLAVAGLAG